MVTVMHTTTAATTFVVCLLVAISPQRALSFNDEFDAVIETTTTTVTEVPESSTVSNSDSNSTIYYISRDDDEQPRRRQQEGERSTQNISVISGNRVINNTSSPNNNATTAATDNVDLPKPEARIKLKNHKRRKNSAISEAIKLASIQGFNAMIDLYDRKEPEILRKGEFLDFNHPAVQLSLFSAPMSNESDHDVRGAFASLYAAKKLQQSLNLDFTGLGRQSSKKRISLQRTQLEGFCPPRDNPTCLPATRRYRTHDGTCNNARKLRWGSAQLPFHRFLPPHYSDGIETVRGSVLGDSLPSARFISLVVHGYRDDEAPITMLLPQWGQLIDHDLTATLQPRSINGSIPRCCQSQDVHPSCLPIQVPKDDPFLGAIGVRCLEFLRSAPAQRRDCLLSWREQSNQVTSYLDGSAVYSSNPRTADASRILRDGLLLFGRGPPREDTCLRGGFNHQCIRAGDTRAGEQPGLLAMHTTFVAEHNRITLELAELNPHWSDEKLYQETRRIIGAIFQHITYREFLPLVLGKEVCRLFDLDLEPFGYYHGYDPKVNPTIANSFSTAAFRFGHSLVQGSMMRSDVNYRFLSNNVSLHEENAIGDLGSVGSLHRIIRGMSQQRTLRRDEFMSPELTNHLFQSGSFPFGMDLAAINIQRGRDHGVPAYVDWRKPCGLSEIRTWEDLENVVGPNSANRIRRAYERVEDIDLFVAGISERPVIGGLVGPTFACIIAQQFSNLRRGDRFWYENANFDSSFTPAQLNSIRQVTLSQILCRQLGSSNIMQPNAFQPPEFPGNERLKCGEGNLAPIRLAAWVERDPFHKESDLPSIHLTNTVFKDDEPFNTDNQASGNIDLNFVEITPILRPNPSTIVDNKVEFTSKSTTKLTPTTKKPKKKRPTTTTRNPSLTNIVDNKIDFKRRSTKKPVVELKAEKVNIISNSNKDNGPLKRSDEDIEIEYVNSRTQFVNEDNATQYYNNRPVAPRLDDQTDTYGNYRIIAPEQRIEIILPQDNNKRYELNDFDYDNNRLNIDFNSRPNSYYPIYSMTPTQTQTQTPTIDVRKPVLYQNNRPIYDSSKVPIKATNSPISSQYLSTPFSYDVFPEKVSPSQTLTAQSSSNYEQISVPIFVTSNRYTTRPTQQNPYTRPSSSYYTTRRHDALSTFMYVGTTRRSPSNTIFFSPSSNVRPTSALNYQLSLSTPSSSFSASSSLSSSAAYADEATNPLPFFVSNTNKISTIKRPATSSVVSNLPSVFSSDKIDKNEFNKFDGYLRPDTSFYIPNKSNQQDSPYIDFKKMTSKPETTTKIDLKFVYLENVLHKYYQKKESEVLLSDRSKSDITLIDNSTSSAMTDEDTTNISETTDIGMNNDDDNGVLAKATSEGRSNKRDDIFIVPFKLLTRIDRPDNWINTELSGDNPELRERLPQVPDLQQNENVAKELPQPLLGKKTTASPKLTQTKT